MHRALFAVSVAVLLIGCADTQTQKPKFKSFDSSRTMVKLNITIPVTGERHYVVDCSKVNPGDTVRTQGGEPPRAWLYFSEDVTFQSVRYNGPIMDDVPMEGPAFMRSWGFQYISDDLDGDNQVSNSVNMTMEFREWSGFQCDTPGDSWFTIDLQNLPDNAWVGVGIGFVGGGVHIPGPCYVSMNFNDERVGPVTTTGRSGDSKRTSNQSLWIDDPDFGFCQLTDMISGSLALTIAGSHNVIFRVSNDALAQMPFLTVGLNDDGFNDRYYAERLWRYEDEDVHYFSKHFWGDGFYNVRSIPMLKKLGFFSVGSFDPENPEIVDIDLRSGDVNGDNVVDDTDLAIVLTNFGLSGD
ncbi:MAG: hypothetical protein HUU60_06690 [Armatimonadetes bacterium]|nr:hypothetical protein [Armatimonadota bacterium]